MANLFEKQAKYLLITINVISIIILIFFAELIEMFLPSQTATMGVRYSRNGSLYGWICDPGVVTYL